MIIKNNNDIILTDNTSVSFIRNILNPNQEIINSKNVLSKILSQFIIEEHDGYFSVDVPWIDISFI